MRALVPPTATKTTALAIAAMLTLAACESDDDSSAKDKIEDVGENVDKKVEETKEKAADAIAAKIEAEVLEYLKCKGITNPNVLANVSKLLKDRKKLTSGELVEAPSGVSNLVGGANDARDYAREIANVARQLADDTGAMKKGGPGWDSSKCDASIKVPCLEGTATIAFSCPAGSKTSVGVGSFDACHLGAYQFDGKMDVRPAPGGKGVELEFKKLAIGSSQVVHGGIVLAGDVTATGLTVGLASSTGKLTVEDHGGYKGGLSCGRTIEFGKLALTITTTKVSADVNIAIKDPDKTIAVTTKDPHIGWSYKQACACPDVGSKVDVKLPRPGGGADDTVTMSLSFAPGAGDLCRQIVMKLDDWPTDCTTSQKITEACGEGPRDVAEKVGSILASQMCVPM